MRILSHKKLYFLLSNLVPIDNCLIFHIIFYRFVFDILYLPTFFAYLSSSASIANFQASQLLKIRTPSAKIRSIRSPLSNAIIIFFLRISTPFYPRRVQIYANLGLHESILVHSFLCNGKRIDRRSYCQSFR